MSGLEAKLIGVVEANAADELHELLLGLSGLPVDAVSVHELVLRPSLADRADLTLQHSVASTSGGQEDRWWACQYGLPLRGKSNISLPATVRSVVRGECSGEDVPGFWRALGFSLRYEMLKRGHSYEVHHGGHCVEVVVSQVLKLPARAAAEGAAAPAPAAADPGTAALPPAAAAGEAAAGGAAPAAGAGTAGSHEAKREEQAQELVPGCLLVEASTVATEGAHMEAATALAAFAKLLQPLATLQPLSAPPRGWLWQQHQ